MCIEIKDSKILKAIKEFQEVLKTINGRIKFVELENIHFTLKFLGNVDPALIEPIHSIMNEIPFSSFSMTLQGVGAFPKSRPRVIWVGISGGSENCQIIAKSLNEKLSNMGFKAEKRKFMPHITIGRVKIVKDKDQLIQILQQWKSHLFGTIQINGFQLKKSELTPKGPIYTTLKERNN
ncbi:MAG: RNA 2',3'-cyclic phosphodiesterase [Candidatus Helarchaeota archaeon]